MTQRRTVTARVARLGLAPRIERRCAATFAPMSAPVRAQRPGQRRTNAGL